MELHHYLSMLGKWLWMIVLATLIAAGASYWATQQQPRIYQTAAKLMVGQSIQSSDPNPLDFQTSGALAGNYITIAKTRPVLQAVIDTLGLSMSTDTLAGMFSATTNPGTQLIVLRVDDVDPARAQAIANELARQLILQSPGGGEKSQQQEFVQSQVDDLQIKIQQAQKNANELRGSIESTLSARDINAKQQEIAALESQIEQLQTTYARLLGFLSVRSPNTLTLIESAELPGYPYAPNVSLNTALAAAIGLMLSLAAIVILEFLDDTIKSPEEAEEMTGLRTLSVMAKIDDKATARMKREVPEKIELANAHDGLDKKLVTYYAPRYAYAEAYRMLRTAIQFEGIEKPIKSILVTSGNLGEGKSLTAANLAIVIAQAGLRTILIDADMRKPFQHHFFNAQNDSGLANCLLSGTITNNAMRATSVENLYLMPSGTLPPNPSELLSSKHMVALKAQLETHADFIIFDAPPCLPVVDASILARFVDGVILIIDIGRTRRRDAVRAKDILRRTGGRVLGIVLNRAQPRADYYYYHDYVDASEKAPMNGKEKTQKAASR